jgi:SAM-dependent methyltransferase
MGAGRRGPSVPRRGGNEGVGPGRRPAASTSWDPLAEWYIGWVGEDGSKHHRLLAIPAVMDALDVRPGQSILDIGCGHGVLSGYVAKAGGRYTGVDASPRLIDFARNHHAREGRFIVGDAGDLAAQKDLRPGSFDAGVFLLSIQDMEPIGPVLGGAARMLKPGGRLVLLMTHPAFRVPRQSGWGWDEGRKLQFRRVDRYLTPLPVPLKSYGDRGGVSRSYHRPLQDYVNGLGVVGLAVDQMNEIPTWKTAEPGPRASAVNRANEEIPLFVMLRAVKVR